MGDLVNLNRARKARARIDRQAKAAENRAVHGRSRADRKAAEVEQDLRDRALDGARIDEVADAEPDPS